MDSEVIMEEQVCRICMEPELGLDWNEEICENSGLTFKDCYVKYTKLEVVDSDPFPQFLCENCTTELKSFHFFIEKAIATQKHFEQKLSECDNALEEVEYVSIVEGYASSSELQEQEFVYSEEESTLTEITQTIQETEYVDGGFAMNNNQTTNDHNVTDDNIEDNPCSDSESEEITQTIQETEYVDGDFAMNNNQTTNDHNVTDDNIEDNPCSDSESEEITQETEYVDGDFAMNNNQTTNDHNDTDDNIEDNPCSDSESEDLHCSARKGKRKRNPQLWKANVRKHLRETGQTYINTRNRKVPAKTVKPPCKDCFLKCANDFTDEDRMNIFQSFWNMSDDEKNNFYINNVTRRPVKRRRSTSDTKRFSFYYHLDKGLLMRRVCRTFFMNTLNIDNKRIYYTFSHLYDEEKDLPLPRRIGKYVKRVTAPNKIAEVQEHISCFPTSHANSKITFTDASLNLTRMHQLYTQKYENPVGVHIYRSVFKKNFDISFQKY